MQLYPRVSFRLLVSIFVIGKRFFPTRKPLCDAKAACQRRFPSTCGPPRVPICKIRARAERTTSGVGARRSARVSGSYVNCGPCGEAAGDRAASRQGRPSELRRAGSRAACRSVPTRRIERPRQSMPPPAAASQNACTSRRRPLDRRNCPASAPSSTEVVAGRTGPSPSGSKAVLFHLKPSSTISSRQPGKLQAAANDPAPHPGTGKSKSSPRYSRLKPAMAAMTPRTPSPI